ncbi:MAG: hypothetical protein FJW31_20120 [Acidobacteria bacterium]|nr:hypothetical protein [Acidobacteriota bacterium]
MAYELIAALHITDAERSTRCRDEIRPLLAQAAAEFRLDAELSRVMRPVDQPRLNRLFVLAFPNQAAKQAFFSNLTRCTPKPARGISPSVSPPS